MSLTFDPNLASRRAVHYPDSDGKPMAESDVHISLIVYCRDTLRLFSSPQADSVSVSGNNFILTVLNDGQGNKALNLQQHLKIHSPGFDPGRQSRVVARITEGLRLRGNLIIVGAYFRSLNASDGLEGTGLRIGLGFRATG